MRLQCLTSWFEPRRRKRRATASPNGVNAGPWQGLEALEQRVLLSGDTIPVGDPGDAGIERTVQPLASDQFKLRHSELFVIVSDGSDLPLRLLVPIVTAVPAEPAALDRTLAIVHGDRILRPQEIAQIDSTTLRATFVVAAPPDGWSAADAVTWSLVWVDDAATDSRAAENPSVGTIHIAVIEPFVFTSSGTKGNASDAPNDAVDVDDYPSEQPPVDTSRTLPHPPPGFDESHEGIPRVAVPLEPVANLAWPRHDEQSSPRPIVTYDHPVTATAAGVTPRRPAVRAGLSILSLTPAEPSPDARDEGPKRRNGEARERVSRVKTALDPETAPNEDAAQPAAAAPDEGIVSALALVAETPAADPPRPRGQGWRWSHSGILLTALACVVLGPTVLPFKSSARERVHRRRRGDGEGDKSEMVPRLTEAQ